MAVFSLDDTPLLTHKLNIGTTNILNIAPDPVGAAHILRVTKSGDRKLEGISRPTIEFEVFNGSQLNTAITWYFRNDDSEADRNTIFDQVNDIIANDLNTAT